MKIVINKCFGGFGLSDKALNMYRQLSNKTGIYGISREDPILIKIVEELGEESYGMCAELKVVEIPDGIQWEIDEYDGAETIHEKHRTWS